MRIRRGPLFWGLFLIPLGGLPLLVRAGVVQPEAFAEAWRFWPVILIALGVAVLLGRGRAGLIGVVIAALTIGALAGGTIASGGRIIGSVTDCANPGSATEEADYGGTFTSAATVSIDLDCGSMDVVSVPGADWQVHAEFGAFVLSKGDGVYVYDENGKQYIEGLAGLWCVSLGFSEERLVQADARQMRKLPYYHVY
ncbi:MAG: DUF5668 domain-containing protein, partial [Chloroflexota bacterium]